MKRLFTAQSKTITGAALVLGAASFVSRIIGVIRDRIFAHHFGVGESLDIYYAAFKVPDLVYNLLIVGALSAGFIPVFLDIWVKDKKRAWHVTNTIIHILGYSLVIVLSVLFVAMPHIIPKLVPGFSPENIQETVRLSRIMLISPLLLGISGIISGVLQSLKSFFIYSLTPILYNIGIIIGAIFLVPLYGISGLAYGVILGACFHLCIQIPTLLSHGFTYSHTYNIKDAYVRKIGKLMIPRTLTLATQQIQIIVITMFASTLAVGSITVFTFAQNLQFFPVGIIGISFALAAFPSLSEYYAKKDATRFVTHLTLTIRQILFLIIPCTVIFLLLRAQIVRVVLGSGKFDWSATILTADTLAFFTLSFFAQCLIPLLVRAFYARHNTIFPLITALFSAGLTIYLSMLLKDSMGVTGLALAFSLSSCFQVALLWVGLRNYITTFKEMGIVSSLYKICTAAIIMAIVVQYAKYPVSKMVDMTTFVGILLQGFIVGFAGLFVYIFVCKILKTEELRLITRSVQKKWLRVSQSQPEVNQGDQV